MKRITKADCLWFNQRVEELLKDYYPAPREHNPGIVRCMTDCGPLQITPDPMEVGDRVPTIFTRFRDTDNPEFRRRRQALDASPVGKWNVHEFTVQEAIQVFERRLCEVDARPLTPAEAAEWHALDVAESAKWKHLRDNYSV